MLVIALVMGIWLAAIEGRRRGVSYDTVLDASLYALIGGLIGTRLFFVAQQFHKYAADFWSIFNLREGGLSYHGAIIGGLVGLLIFARRRKIPVSLLADLYAVSALAGLAVGRIGCLMNGCCYGKPFDGPWAVHLPEVAPALIGRHPVQIYEALLCVAGVGLLALWNRRRLFDGEIILAFGGIYSVIRFLMEFLREGHLLPGGLTLAQYVSIPLALLCFASIVKGRAKARRSGG
jgi:phosphatidylglycerol:prolipoprotein diacylglycerol transferase